MRYGFRRRNTSERFLFFIWKTFPLRAIARLSRLMALLTRIDSTVCFIVSTNPIYSAIFHDFQCVIRCTKLTPKLSNGTIFFAYFAIYRPPFHRHSLLFSMAISVDVLDAISIWRNNAMENLKD